MRWLPASWQAVWMPGSRAAPCSLTLPTSGRTTSFATRSTSWRCRWSASSTGVTGWRTCSAPRSPVQSDAAAGTRESATGAIYDLGYRGYDGPRLGRPAAVATLFWASLRAAYALRRSGRAKIVPWGLAALLVAPAGVSVAVAALAPMAPTPFTYDDYLWGTQILVAIFVAAQAPELVSSDQSNRVLSLYF